jgi:hypothetical protein
VFEPRFLEPLGLGSHAHAQARDLGDPSGAHLGRALGSPVAPSSHDDWALDLTAQTSLPLSIGVEAQLESPIGVTFHLGLGHTPEAYFGVIASALRDNGVYGPNIDPLVRDAIGNGGWNARVGIGYAFDVGLEVAAGYTFIGGNTNLSFEAIEAATGQNLRWPGMEAVPLAIEIHAIHARLGWRFIIERHLVLRFALGWTHSVANSVHVTVPPEADPPGGPADQFEVDIHDGIDEYGFTPELLLSAGYRF